MGLADDVVSGRERDFSVQRAFHARSPMISLLLPTAIERLEISQVKRSHLIQKRQKRKLERDNLTQSNNGANTKMTTKGQQGAVSRHDGVLSAS